MCFSLQRRALLRHLDVQKWSEHVVLCTFWLGHVLRAATACTFSLNFQKRSGAEVLLRILTWKCASCYEEALNFQNWSGAEVLWTFWLGNLLRAATACNFSTSNLQKWAEVFSPFWLRNVLAPAAFKSLLLDPLEPQISVKMWFFAACLPFRAPAPASSLFWFCLSLIFSLLTFFLAVLFHLPILSEVWLLNFLR